MDYCQQLIMTKFKDVAHLYLNCPIWYKDKLWDLTGVSQPYSTNDTFFVNLDLRPEGKGFRSISYVSESFTDLSLIKPILRPLSSMDEDECNELDEEMYGANFMSCHIRKTILEPWESEYRPGFPMYVKAINWLRKKGFDCDELIESGEALATPPTTKRNPIKKNKS
jgi:hypothetical protein